MLIFAQIEAFILKMGGKIGMEYFDMERQCLNLIFTVWCKFLCILEITLKATNSLEKVVSYILQQISNL